jgi:hypothetical protein
LTPCGTSASVQDPPALASCASSFCFGHPRLIEDRLEGRGSIWINGSPDDVLPLGEGDLDDQPSTLALMLTMLWACRRSLTETGTSAVQLSAVTGTPGPEAAAPAPRRSARRLARQPAALPRGGQALGDRGFSHKGDLSKSRPVRNVDYRQELYLTSLGAALHRKIRGAPRHPAATYRQGKGGG